MSRPILPEPYAAAATWTRRLAATGSLLAFAAVLLAHRPAISRGLVLAVLGVGLGCAILALPCAVRAVRRIWRTGEKGTGRMLAGLGLAAVTLAYPGYVAAIAVGSPFVAAATTNAADPPPFSRTAKVLALRGLTDGTGPSSPSTMAVAEPIVLDLDGTEAFSAVQKAVASLRWRVIESVAPGKRGAGHLDAMTVSPVMRLPQDIAIRIQPLAGQTRVDITSASRLGVYDFGESLSLVRQFAAAVADQADDQ